MSPGLIARTVLMSQAGSACVEPRAAEESRCRSDFLQALYGPREGSLISPRGSRIHSRLSPSVSGRSPHVFLPLQHPATQCHTDWRDRNMYSVVFSTVELAPVASRFVSLWGSGRMLSCSQGNVYLLHQLSSLGNEHRWLSIRRNV